MGRMSDIARVSTVELSTAETCWMCVVERFLSKLDEQSIHGSHGCLVITRFSEHCSAAEMLKPSDERSRFWSIHPSLGQPGSIISLVSNHHPNQPIFLLFMVRKGRAGASNPATSLTAPRQHFV
jgi:hypothetical protein